MNTPKDPLAYKVHQLPAGTLATFDGRKIQALPADGPWTVLVSSPEGRENDYQLIVAAGTTSAMVDGGDRGRLVVRGNLLTFHYDNGKTSTGEWKFDGGGSALMLNKAMYLRQ